LAEHLAPGTVPLLWEGAGEITFPDGHSVEVPGRLVWMDRPVFRWDTPGIILPRRSASASFGSLACGELLVTTPMPMPGTPGEAIPTGLRMAVVPVQSVEFHLVNFKRLGRGRYAVGPFLVTLVPAHPAHDHSTIFTHLGRIERQDGTCFLPGSEEYELLLSTLTWGFSFISASLVTPLLERGFDEDGKLIWADYSPRRLTKRPAKDDNWIHSRSPNAQSSVQEVLDGFHRLLSEPVWADAVGLAVDFSLNAAEPALVTGASLILLQAGLEKLVSAWWACEKVTLALPSASKEKFGRRLGRMLVWAGIGTAVPDQLPALAYLVAESSIADADAPTVLAHVRNELTHVKRPDSLLTDRHEIQATRLASRYLELLLLRLAGATTPVINPLVTDASVTTVEPFPWS